MNFAITLLTAIEYSSDPIIFPTTFHITPGLNICLLAYITILSATRRALTNWMEYQVSGKDTESYWSLGKSVVRPSKQIDGLSCTNYGQRNGND